MNITLCHFSMRVYMLSKNYSLRCRAWYGTADLRSLSDPMLDELNHIGMRLRCMLAYRYTDNCCSVCLYAHVCVHGCTDSHLCS